MDDEGCGTLIMGAIAIAIVIYVGRAVLSALYTVFASVSYLAIWGLDWLTSNTVVADKPYVMWAFWGALLGGILAFWPMAPIYGLRKARRFLIPAVVAVMAAIAVIRQTM